MRHPSQLYEAFAEGLVIAIILYIFRAKKPFDGALIAWYGMLYGIMRFIVEFYRMPDSQLGYVCCGMSMGQLMSLGMIIFFVAIFYIIKMNSKTLRA
jgi:phosphatidylglycerol:prolipoprotein diacylglycerol transferase